MIIHRLVGRGLAGPAAWLAFLPVRTFSRTGRQRSAHTIDRSGGSCWSCRRRDDRPSPIGESAKLWIFQPECVVPRSDPAFLGDGADQANLLRRVRKFSHVYVQFAGPRHVTTSKADRTTTTAAGSSQAGAWHSPLTRRGEGSRRDVPGLLPQDGELHCRATIERSIHFLPP